MSNYFFQIITNKISDKPSFKSLLFVLLLPTFFKVDGSFYLHLEFIIVMKIADLEMSVNLSLCLGLGSKTKFTM